MTVEANAIEALGVVAPDTHLVRAQGPFQLRRIRPGLALGRTDDAGFGGLGLIDHARLQPGLIVKMHEHRNDEIISYMRSGRMQHTDSAGRSEVISPDRLMVMNAGRGFSHEEAVIGDEPIEMLQIFVRPKAASMEPGVQFVSLDEAARIDRWRLLTGPIGSTAPSFVRQAIYLYDTQLSAARSIDLPTVPGFDRWLYVFRGKVSVGDQQAETHTALTISADQTALEVTASREADLVLFLVDRQAPFSRAGTMSG
ncbi:MAG: pirin-related protein [Tardiphaga sp.]|nr:pirin-related protein [Tardiphaga sp.]